MSISDYLAHKLKAQGSFKQHTLSGQWAAQHHLVSTFYLDNCQPSDSNFPVLDVYTHSHHTLLRLSVSLPSLEPARFFLLEGWMTHGYVLFGLFCVI